MSLNEFSDRSFVWRGSKPSGRKLAIIPTGWDSEHDPGHGDWPAEVLLATQAI